MSRTRTWSRAGLILLVLLVPCVATVTWAGWASVATGPAAGRTATLAAPVRPDAAPAGAGAQVTWPSTALATGYVVERTHQETGTVQPATGNCAGIVTTTSCTDGSLATGTWTYRVRARLASWAGPWSPASAAVAVDGVVTATLDASPRSVTPGDPVGLTGAGWPAGDAVAITFGGAPLCTTAADGAGAFATSCDLPARAAGRYAVRAASGLVAVTSGELTVVPGLRSVSPSVSAGGALSFTARGFAGTSQLNLWLDERPLGVRAIPSSGEAPLSVPVPADTTPGGHTLRVTDSEGNEASASVTVDAPTILVSAASAAVGDTIRVTGSGWRPGGAVVRITLRSTQLCSLSPDPEGAISGDCTIPEVPGGATMVAADDGTSIASASLRVLSTVTSGSAITSPGSTINLFGHGYASGSLGQVTIGGTPVTTTSEARGSTIGTLNAAVVIPALDPGTYEVRLTDAAGNTAVTSVKVTAPELVLGQTSGAPQSKFTATGRYWPANVSVTVKIDGVLACTPSTGGDGAFVTSDCTVPVLAGGEHTLTAASTTTALRTPLVFTVTAKVTAQHGTVAPGQTTTVSGMGLPASTDVRILMGGQEVATARTAGDGTLSKAVVVPALPAGATSVQVTGAFGTVETLVTMLRPTLAVDVATILPGKTSVRLSGSGWPANQLVKVQFGGLAACASYTVADRLDFTCTPGALPAGTDVVVTGAVGPITATATTTVSVGTWASTDVATARPGYTLYADARGLYAGRTAQLFVNGVLYASQLAPYDGTWRRAYTVPLGTPAGTVLEFEFRQPDAAPVAVSVTVTS